jgi:acetylornithine deacetylase/succinyl-diaminopimelate desuccinylase-like protein
MQISERILELTKHLIMIESVSSDIEKLHKIVNFVENYLKENITEKYFIEKLEFNKKPSFIIKNFN